MNLQIATPGTNVRRQLKGRGIAAVCGLTLAVAAATGIGVNHAASHAGSTGQPVTAAHAAVSVQPLIQADGIPAELSGMTNLQASVLALQPSTSNASIGPIVAGSADAALSDLENLRQAMIDSAPVASFDIRADLSDLDNLQQAVLHAGR